MAFRLRPQSIHGELALLVAVLVLPLAAITAYLLYAQAQRELTEAQADIRRLAENHADRAARFVADTRAVLQAVAWRPLVRAMDPARCDPGLRELLDLYPKAANFLVVDREGRILCGAIPPPADRVLGIVDELPPREVLATGSFALSRPIIGRVSRRWMVAAVQPVVGEDGTVAGTVSMAIDLASLDLLPLKSGLPAGTTVALLDHSVVIARSSEPEAWIGRDLAGSEIMAHVRAAPAGTVRERDAADADRIWGFQRVAATDWIVLASIPAEQVIGPVQERTTKVVLLASLVIALVIALAVTFARRLARPIALIAEALRMRATGRGDAPLPVTGPRELAAVATELNRSSERTERALMALESSERRYRLLFETNPQPMWIYDKADLRFVAVNDAAVRRYGYAREEFLAMTVLDIRPAEERERFLNLDRTAQGPRQYGVWRHLTKGGESIDVGIFSNDFDWEGRRTRLVLVNEISERLRAERRLELTQRMFAALSEVNETLVRVREREELFREVCRICVERMHFLVASIALVDHARRRIVPHVFAGSRSGVMRDVTFPLDPSDPLAVTVTATAVRTNLVAVANDADGDPTKAVARPIRERIGSRSTASFPLSEGGSVIGALTVHADAVDFFNPSMVELLTRMADDISFALDKLAERDKLGALTRELEERVRQRTTDLEAANLELEAFSYSVSHDLRAPVRHVDGFLRLLEKEVAPPSAKAAHYIATIAAAARRMGTLIDDLLTLSRTGRQELALQRVDLGALVRDLIRELGAESGKRKVLWAIDDLPEVMADASLLRIVLQNLLSNALKYSRAQPMARIAVEARAGERGAVEITVRDNGVGFDARFKDKLFGVFQRLHRDEEFEGTGIGLATARRIVHRHGHRIWAVGEPGKGAAFTFTLTQAEAAHEGSAHIAG
ncbi:MAG: ATP-binding protein [Betaproteobacteria bacterium]|nr:ATP-binding protein [Betaproteobacteria bacterium]